MANKDAGINGIKMRQVDSVKRVGDASDRAGL